MGYDHNRVGRLMTRDGMPEHVREPLVLAFCCAMNGDSDAQAGYLGEALERLMEARDAERKKAEEGGAGNLRGVGAADPGRDSSVAPSGADAGDVAVGVHPRGDARGSA